jgi:hypothetical protein
MSTTFGSGEYRYRVVEDWAKLPPGWSLGDVAGVGIDARDNVYLFHRGPHPLIVLDRDGNYVRSWGDEIFTRAHGVHIGPDDTIWLTDDGDHTVRQCTLDGRVLVTLGVPGEPAPFMSGHPFRRCTHTALSPKGDVYVSDGYGNARVHMYSPDGRRIRSWGGPGCGPGEFNLPHNIACDADGWVYVADRENHRIHYTRPAVWQGRTVPEVLISGHHERIRAWRLERAEEITRARRPDLWSRYVAGRKV